MIGSQGSFIDGLAAAARENPLAAALIGGGALWLLIGSDKLKNAGSSVTSAAAAPLADIGVRAQRSAALIAGGWSPPVSYLISAIVAGVLAGILFAVGMNRLDARHLAPRETLRQLEKDKDTVKGMVR